VNGYTCADDSSCVAPATKADIVSYVKNHAPMGIDPNRIMPTVSWVQQPDSPAVCGPTATNPNPPSPFTSFHDNYPGCTVEVQVSYQFIFTLPFIYNKPLALSSSSEMIIAH